MAKGLSLMWSEGVTEQESALFAGTIGQALTWLMLHRPSTLSDPPIRVRPFGNWVIPQLMPNKPYWGTQWYIDRSYDREVGRVVTPIFLELVRQEPWQQVDPHLDLALLDQDLTDLPAPLARLRPRHYCLGSSYPGTAAVLSVARLRALSEDDQAPALARLVRHQLGHVLGVPDLARTVDVERLGLELHCTNRCAMRHADTPEELVALAQDEAPMGWPFCEACTRELHSVIARHHFVWS